MIKHIFGAGLIVGAVAAALTIGGAARAESAKADTAAAASASEWKSPQVVGSAPVKDPPKSTEAAAPRPVGQNPYGAKAKAGAAAMPE
jgi:hypothetical protein